VGFINSPYWSEVSETTLCNLKNHIDCSGFSFDWIDAGLDFEYIKEVAITIANFEICASFRTLQILRKVVASKILEEQAPNCSSRSRYRESLLEMRHIGERLAPIFRAFDLIALPSAVGPAPIGLRDKGDPAPTSLGSLLGLPTLGAPIFKTIDGYPLGCQFIGKAHSEKLLFDFITTFR
jgi:Asp-tRNA(Asn)/Glu-tRNA(Gln) amidotransferase A subunit family amidase